VYTIHRTTRLCRTRLNRLTLTPHRCYLQGTDTSGLPPDRHHDVHHDTSHPPTQGLIIFRDAAPWWRVGWRCKVQAIQWLQPLAMFPREIRFVDVPGCESGLQGGLCIGRTSAPSHLYQVASAAWFHTAGAHSLNLRPQGRCVPNANRSKRGPVPNVLLFLTQPQPHRNGIHWNVRQHEPR